MLLAVAAPACAPARTGPPAPPARPSVCYACFWKYQPDGLERELLGVYAEKRYDAREAEAERRLVLARVRDDAAATCAARDLFAGETALLAAETAAFMAAECGVKPAPLFGAASRAAGEAGQAWKAEVYAGLARRTFAPKFGDVPIARRLVAPPDATRFVLGASAIVVRPGTSIGCQVDRVARDWLSYRLDWVPSRDPLPADRLLPWHEGARLRDVLSATDARVLPLSGVLAARREGRWFAADDAGVFRFEVLEDKVQYPTTRAYGDLALLVDTHGISALVEPALRERVSLVVGCGDTEGKMQAAFALAARGVDVYFPCDRFVGDLLGYDAPGVLIGSAPVRAERGSAVIGDRPVAFAVDERIVVEDFAAKGGDRYYDAPARYFRTLAGALPRLRLDVVAVDGPGQSSRIVERASATGATAIAVRVATESDATPVRAWLAGARNRRAVLFHSAPYPAGIALFADFPGQTTFGDPRPRFTPS